MKHLESFELFEGKKSRKKGGLMSNSNRKNIVREAKRLIKSEVKDYDDQEAGKKESILDDYIEKVCKEKGFDMAHFYATDCKTINKLLGWD